MQIYVDKVPQNCNGLYIQAEYEPILGVERLLFLK